MSTDFIFHLLFYYLGLDYVKSIRTQDLIMMAVSFLTGFGICILISAKGRIDTYQTKLETVAATIKEGKLILRTPRNIHEGVTNVLIVMFKRFMFRKGNTFEVHSEVRARRIFTIVFVIVIVLFLISLVDNWHVTLDPPINK